MSGSTIKNDTIPDLSLAPATIRQMAHTLFGEQDLANVVDITHSMAISRMLHSGSGGFLDKTMYPE